MSGVNPVVVPVVGDSATALPAGAAVRAVVITRSWLMPQVVLSESVAAKVSDTGWPT